MFWNLRLNYDVIMLTAFNLKIFFVFDLKIMLSREWKIFGKFDFDLLGKLKQFTYYRGSVGFLF